MIYDLRHRTSYAYEGAVSSARCVLRLTPRSRETQCVLASAITISPTPSRSVRRLGPFGEETLTVLIEEPHRALVIEARSRVEVWSLAAPVRPVPSWEEIRAVSFQSATIGPDGPAAFLYPTPRTPVVAAITDYARASLCSGRPVLDAAIALMTRIWTDFTYDPKATTVSTPAAEAFRARRGVCQDFAHIMISGLRGLGLPARYVSGYLRTVPPPGRPRLEGADATHAWVELWCGEGVGWIGLDPTNAVLAREDHIILATGRDYSDVAPIDGIILAPGDQTLKVEVDVVPVTAAGDATGPRTERGAVAFSGSAC